MIQVIHGKKGSGKTKKLLDKANETIKVAKGDIVFIDDDNRYMFDLGHEIRFINASEYSIVGPDAFYGYICGILAQNFDIHYIFVDAFMKLVAVEAEQTRDFFEKLAAIAEKRNITFVMSVNVDDAIAPDFMKQYFI